MRRNQRNITPTWFALLSLILSSSCPCRAEWNDCIDEDKTTFADPAVETETEILGQALIDWVRSLGGYVHPHQVIRRDEHTGVRGVYVTAPIANGEMLLDIPPAAILTATSHHYNNDDDEDDDDDDNNDDNEDDFSNNHHKKDKKLTDSCGTVQALQREMMAGDKSPFWPYTRLLREKIVLPDTYSEAGKQMLEKVVGPYLEPQSIGRHFDWYEVYCVNNYENKNINNKSDQEHSNEDEHKKQILLNGRDHVYVHDPTSIWHAVLLNVARGCESHSEREHWEAEDISLMVPFNDMYNHRNGDERWYSTRIDTHWSTDRTGLRYFRVYATRDLATGDQIYNSYGDDTDILLSHYGFVQDYPRQWTFAIPAVDKTTHTISFVIDQDYDDEADYYDDKVHDVEEKEKEESCGWSGCSLTLEWTREELQPTRDDLDFLQFYEQTRLSRLAPDILACSTALTQESDASASSEDGAKASSNSSSSSGQPTCPPATEMGTISLYYHALKEAIDLAVEAGRQEMEE